MMVGFSLVDDTFDPNISESYFLSIQIDLDGLSFCTLDPVRNKYIQLRHVPLKSGQTLTELSEECFKNIEILNLPFKNTLILYPSRQATMIPTGIFDPALKSEWLQFCVTPDDDCSILYNKVRMADAYNVFAIPGQINEIMTRQFPRPLFFHQYTTMIESNLSANIKGNESASLYINLNTSYFDVVAFGKNNLKLCNSFPIKSDNDFIYFTLFVFEQLKLEPANTRVVLSGRHPGFANLNTELANYIRDVKHADFSNRYQYSYHFRKIHLTGFHNLLNLASCV